VYFFGTFEHSIDERGRLAIPARYRSAFVDGGVLRPGPEGGLELYTNAGFDTQFSTRLAEATGNNSPDARRLRRGFMSVAYPVELGNQGRILIERQLRDSAMLTGKILIIGCGDYLELWHPDRWAQELARIAALQAEADRE